MKSNLIEEEIRLKFEYSNLYAEMDQFLDNYECKKCNNSIKLLNGRKQCAHLLNDYKRKFTSKLLTLARRKNELIIRREQEESNKISQPFLVGRYT